MIETVSRDAVTYPVTTLFICCTPIPPAASHVSYSFMLGDGVVTPDPARDRLYRINHLKTMVTLHISVVLPELVASTQTVQCGVAAIDNCVILVRSKDS